MLVDVLIIHSDGVPTNNMVCQSTKTWKWPSNSSKREGWPFLQIHVLIVVSDDPKSIGFYVFQGGKRVIKAKKDLLVKKSKFGKMAEGSVFFPQHWTYLVVSEVLKLTANPDVPYIIVPCTIEADQEASYTLSVLSDDPNFIVEEECQAEIYELSEEMDLDMIKCHVKWRPEAILTDSRVNGQMWPQEVV